MKKTILSLLAVAMLFGGYVAAENITFAVPSSQKGAPVHPLYGGYKYKRLASTTETLVCTAPCLLAGILMSTGAATNEVQIRDTGTADGGNSTYVIQATFDVDCHAKQANVVPLPIRATYGWSVDLKNITNNEMVTVLYMDLD